MAPMASDRSFARAIAAKYDDPSRATRFPEAEIACDALWLLTSPDADLREMGLHVLAIGPPTLVAELYPRMRGNDVALDDVARMVQGELALLERSGDEWRSLERFLHDQPALREAWPEMVREEVASRRRWASAMFDAMGGDDAADLQRRVVQVERRTLSGAYAKRR